MTRCVQAQHCLCYHQFKYMPILMNRSEWITKKVTGCAKICLVLDKKSAQSTFQPLLKIFIRSECINQGVLSVDNHITKISSAYHPALQITVFILLFKFKMIGGMLFYSFKTQYTQNSNFPWMIQNQLYTSQRCSGLFCREQRQHLKLGRLSCESLQCGLSIRLFSPFALKLNFG